MNLTGQKPYVKGRKRKREKPTDRPYLEYLKTLPCCVCGKAPPSDPAYVRLNGRGGMGMKPLFSAVPLCAAEHRRQHQNGHLSIMPTEEWLRLADEYLMRWRDRKEFEH